MNCIAFRASSDATEASGWCLSVPDASTTWVLPSASLRLVRPGSSNSSTNRPCSGMSSHCEGAGGLHRPPMLPPRSRLGGAGGGKGGGPAVKLFGHDSSLLSGLPPGVASAAIMPVGAGKLGLCFGVGSWNCDPWKACGGLAVRKAGTGCCTEAASFFTSVSSLSFVGSCSHAMLSDICSKTLLPR